MSEKGIERNATKKRFLSRIFSLVNLTKQIPHGKNWELMSGRGGKTFKLVLNSPPHTIRTYQSRGN